MTAESTRNATPVPAHAVNTSHRPAVPMLSSPSPPLALPSELMPPTGTSGTTTCISSSGR